EVKSVFGKAGRAESATDPAPIEMFETTIQLKPRDQWRAGMTQDKLVEELDRIVKVPGLANIWVPPIRNRIDMLATGIKSPVGVKVAGTDLATIDRLTGEIERALKDVKLPPGYSVSWSGQFEFLERATAKLKLAVPFTLAIIFVLLYLSFKRFDEALLIMATLPFALVGGIWLLYLLGYNLSVAGAVGFVALAGVAAEFGVIMLLYLRQAWDKRLARGAGTAEDLLAAIRDGAVLRV